MNNSSLFDESTFYTKFSKDLLRAKHEVIIESPFITLDRAKSLTPIFNKLIKRGVKIYVITRDPSEHQEPGIIAKSVGKRVLLIDITPQNH